MTNDRYTEKETTTILHQLFPEEAAAPLLPGVRDRIQRRKSRHRRLGLSSVVVAAMAAAVVVPQLVHGSLDKAAVTTARTPVATHGSPARVQGSSRSHSTTPNQQTPAASCAAVLVFQHHSYLPATLTSASTHTLIPIIPASHMHKIALINVPPCNDTNLGTASETSIAIARIDGVDVETAFAVLQAGRVYVRRGAMLPAELQNAPWVERAEP